MKITPELIPHRDFHKGKWLLPTERSGWYYFTKKKNANTITSRSFLKSVDEPLRELVRFLHTKGIKTTPSCAGHHLSERNLEKIYDDLMKDADEIKQQGLQLKDVETGKSYLYKDKHYQLPWSRDSFLQKVTEYQQKGILGIRTSHHQKEKEQILKLRVPGADIREKDSILFIHTTANGTGDSRHVWKEITHSIKNIFNQAPTMIRKLQSGEYRLYSRKINPKTGKRRNLGTFHSLEAAKKHEREIQYFKRH